MGTTEISVSQASKYFKFMRFFSSSGKEEMHVFEMGTPGPSHCDQLARYATGA